ncbi:MAG: glycosyltransferase family 4 protein [Candidatus Limnocylindrales bacterium]
MFVADRQPLRIAQVAPPFERVPPHAYGGTERVVWELARELDRRGHEVTTFASGDSDVPGQLVATVHDALRPTGFGGDGGPYMLATLTALLDRASDFDIIHSHLEWWSLLLSRVSPVPVVATFHGRLDQPVAKSLLERPPAGLVAISQSQASAHPDVAWTVIYNGLTLDHPPLDRRRGDDLCFVGRVDPEKGVLEAIEIAVRSGRRLRIAAKVGTRPHQRDYYDNVFQPALEAARPAVDFLGEIGSAERDELMWESYATLMPGSWPEPFGLVAIESLACGTPVLARRVGALPEIVREGVDGLFGDDVEQLVFQLDRMAGLDREAMRASVIERFSAGRMTDRYEALYAQQLGRNEPVLLASAGSSSGR